MVKALKTTLGLLLLFAMLVVAVALFLMLGKWFLSLPAATQTPLAALVGVLSVPIITYFTARALERGRSRESAIREQKTKFYDSTISGLMKMLGVAGTGPMPAQDVTKLFAEVTPQLITYGSRKVILAWNNFRQVSAQHTGSDADSLASLLAFEGLLKAMREDLGHSTYGASEGELLAIFVTDIGPMLKERRRPKSLEQ